MITPATVSDMDDIVSLWNRCACLDSISHQDLTCILFCDDNFSTQNVLVYREDNQILGAILGIRRQYPYLDRGLEPDKGWILSIIVAPEAQRRGIGTQLLASLERQWRQEGVTKFILAAFSPYYFFPGIEDGNTAARSFFEARGYVCKAPAYQMERSLMNFEIPQSIVDLKNAKEKEGYRYAPFTWPDSLPLLEFIKNNFSTGWYNHIRQAMRSHTAPEQIWLCFYHDEIAGYLQRNMDGNPHRLGPFGVTASHRNGGVGTILLYLMWQSMCRYHLEYVFFQSTDDPGRRFYERNGMSVTRIFHHYEKP